MIWASILACVACVIFANNNNGEKRVMKKAEMECKERVDIRFISFTHIFSRDI